MFFFFFSSFVCVSAFFSSTYTPMFSGVTHSVLSSHLSPRIVFASIRSSTTSNSSPWSRHLERSRRPGHVEDAARVPGQRRRWGRRVDVSSTPSLDDDALGELITRSSGKGRSPGDVACNKHTCCSISSRHLADAQAQHRRTVTTDERLEGDLLTRNSITCNCSPTTSQCSSSSSPPAIVIVRRPRGRPPRRRPSGGRSSPGSTRPTSRGFAAVLNVTMPSAPASCRVTPVVVERDVP